MRKLTAIVISEYPRLATQVVLLLFLAGVAGGVGVVSLLPLLGLLVEGGPHQVQEEAGTFVRTVISILEWTGIPLSIGPLLTVLVVTSAMSALLTMIAMRQANYASAWVAADLRLRLIRSLLKARWSYFAALPAGRLSNAVSSEAERAGRVVGDLCNIGAGTIQLLVYFLIASLTSWQVTIAAIVFGFVMLYLFRGAIRLSRHAGESHTDLIRELVTRLTDAIGMIKPLKAMAREDAVQPLLEQQTRQLDAARRQAIKSETLTSNMQEPLTVLLLAIGMYVTLRSGLLGFDEILFMAFLFHRTMSKIGLLQRQYQKIATDESALWSIRESIHEASEHSEHTTGRRRPPLERAITFQDVSFSYGDAQVLSGFNTEIPAGRLTAVVGPSGTGKTTLIDLLLGLHRPDQGTIWIDDVPLSEADLIDWRRRVGYVPQDVVLLNGSLRENVSLNDPSITASAIETALEEAGAAEFVNALPNGLDTEVGERGMRFSGGQRQRVSIARALVRRPELLILDEATTGLDPETERSIYDHLALLRGKVTILAVSHQAAARAAADEVIDLARSTKLPPHGGPSFSGSARE